VTVLSQSHLAGTAESNHSAPRKSERFGKLAFNMPLHWQQTNWPEDRCDVQKVWVIL